MSTSYVRGFIYRAKPILCDDVTETQITFNVRGRGTSSMETMSSTYKPIPLKGMAPHILGSSSITLGSKRSAAVLLYVKGMDQIVVLTFDPSMPKPNMWANIIDKVEGEPDDCLVYDFYTGLSKISDLTQASRDHLIKALTVEPHDIWFGLSDCVVPEGAMSALSFSYDDVSYLVTTTVSQTGGTFSKGVVTLTVNQYAPAMIACPDNVVHISGLNLKGAPGQDEVSLEAGVKANKAIKDTRAKLSF